jgi:cell volume regulation protein A
VSYQVTAASAAAGARIKLLPVPEGMLVTLIVRDHEVLAPRGETTLHPGVHVYVFTNASDRPMFDLLIGPPEE